MSLYPKNHLASPVAGHSRYVSRCVIPLSLSQDPSLSLVLLPHAGGGAGVYREWKGFPSNIELYAVQLPGRESRFTERPFRRMEPLVEELTLALEPMCRRPLALFGHSMGAAVAFDLACSLRERLACDPLYVFVSGYPAPRTVVRRVPPTYALSDADFVDELRRLGTSAEVLSMPDVLQTMLPTVRADFEVIETWVPLRRRPLECALVALRGCDDPSVEDEALEAWRYETTGPFEMVRLPGDHFYHLRNQSLSRLLTGYLEAALARA